MRGRAGRPAFPAVTRLAWSPGSVHCPSGAGRARRRVFLRPPEPRVRTGTYRGAAMTTVIKGEDVRLIAGRQIAVGATLGMVPVPGLAPPPAVAARLPGVIANMRRLREAGAMMVAGTDAGIGPVKPHDVLRYAPVMLRQLGFSPAEALRTITSVAAGVCGLGHRKGRIAPGFDADILAVDGDPVADPEALHRIRAVYARGTAVTRPGG